MPTTRSQKEVLIRLIENSIRNEETGCLLWCGYTTTSGYGKVGWQGEWIAIHRLIYFWFTGTWPEVVRHSCDTPNCWDINHLLGGTHFDNMQDKVIKGRHPVGMAQVNAKLMDDDIRYIRTSVLSVVSLTKKYSVSRTLIYSIRAREKWAHIKD